MWDFDQGKYVDSGGLASFEESGALNESLVDMKAKIATLESFMNATPDRFLRKDIEDVAHKMTTFEKGLHSDLVRSRNYSSGMAGSGFQIKHDETGSHLEVDYATFRKKAYFYELVIQQLSHQGGILFFTPARMECSEVQITADGFKCFFDTKEGTVSNDFAVGDQARCQRFQLGMTTAKYYWRLVTEVGQDYIVLSLSDADAGSDQPQAGDLIVQLGNRNDPTRQAAKVTTVIGHEAPRDEYYEGIDSYDLTGKLITVVGVRDGKVGIFTDYGAFSGAVTIGANSAGLENLAEWADKQSQIDKAHEYVDRLQVLIDHLNDDTILDVSEKFSLRTEWEKINGAASLVESGDSGSYMTALKTLETLGYNQGEDIIITYNGSVITYNGVRVIYNQTEIEEFRLAYETLKEYFVSVRLYENTPTEGFDRQEAARILYTYYDSRSSLLDLAQKYHVLTVSSEAVENFVNTTYKETIARLQESIDKKSETFRQPSDPSADWKDQDTRALHEGDVWWNTSEQTINGVPAGTTAIYAKSGDTFVWDLQPVPKEVFDYADGKAAIHVEKPSSYHANDLWILENDTVMEGFKAGTMLVASATSETFNASHWSKRDNYSDDSRANEAAKAAAAAAELAKNASEAAGKAQTAADNAKREASAASKTLSDWSADNIISPVEKTGVRDELAFIQSDMTDIANQQSRYGIASGGAEYTSYLSAYTTYKADLNTILNTAGSVTVPSEMTEHQTAFYTARTNILNVIADAAKAVADNAQEAADDAQKTADKAQNRADEVYSYAKGLKELLDKINDDTVLNETEKASIRTQWEMISGVASLSVPGKGGSYQTALNLAETIGGRLGIPMIITYNGMKITYNGNVITYNISGLDQMKAAYEELKTYLSSVRLYSDEPTEGFDRERFAALITAYYAAEQFFLTMAQAAYTNEKVEDASSALAENLATNMGYDSYDDMVQKAISEGKTITKGGYINTDLIEAEAILADHIASGAITSEKIKAGAITADKIKAKSLTAEQIDLIKLFSEFIQASNMHILQGCKIANIEITETGIRIDTTQDGSIYIDEDRGISTDHHLNLDAGKQYARASMGGCAGTAISALAGANPPQHCVHYNGRTIGIEAFADQEGAAFYSQCGLFVGFRPAIRNLGVTGYTELTTLDHTVMVTSGSIELPYDTDVSRPAVPLGHTLKIIHTTATTLTIYTDIAIRTLGSTTVTFEMTSTKAEVIDLVYDGSNWFKY